MRFSKSLVVSLAALMLLSASCITPRKGAPMLNEEARLNFARNFFEGSKNKMLGNTEQALGNFLTCIKIDPKADAAMYEAALLFATKGKFDNALFFMKGAVSVQPDNIWYQLTLAELFQKNKLYKDAVKVFEGLSKNYPERVDFYFNLSEAMLFDGDVQGAIKVYDNLESKIGVNPDISVQKQKLYLRMGKFDKAVAEMKKLIAAFPTEPKYYALLAEMYQANKMHVEAMEVLQKVKEFDPENPYLHLSLAEFYRSNNEKEKSFNELKLAFASKRLDLDTKVGILSSYFTLVSKFPELKDQALELNKLLIEAHPTESRAFAVYGDFLYLDKQSAEARTRYRQALQLDKQSFMVWQQLLLVESDLKDFEAMMSESEEAITLFPSQPVVYFFNGVAKIQLNKEKEAIEMLNTGLKLVVENDPLLVQFYANIGDAHNKLKEYTKSDEAFDQAVRIDPNNSYVLNNYSYYLSLRGDSLDKAERMSKLTNEIEPANASFQDTYGWILYMQGKYEDAKVWIGKSMQNGGDKHAVILEHYGDVLWKLRQTDEALSYWEKARQAGTGSDMLERKIKDKKLIEQ